MYSGHTTACAAALANLDIIEREVRDTRARDLEGPSPLRSRL
jgi:adenosylmethionine-8-amino-7-oxononanoate aminotransferase